MRAKRTLSLIAAAVVIAALAAVGATLGTGTDKKAPPKTGFIQGKVTSGGNHAEAGVWVIAETSDLPTPYRKIVVTDERGRFVVPELPEADYRVWVRGYGLNDSFKVPVTVERKAKARVAIKAEVAGTPQEEAANYPANYWLSLFKPPANTQALPGMRNQHAWISDFKLGCELCHQIGSASARGMRGNRPGLDAGLKKAETWTAPRSASAGTRCSTRSPTGAAASPRPGARGAAAPEGHRAQHGHHPVGLGRHVHLRARRDRHRQAQPAALPRREDLGRRPRQRPPAGVDPVPTRRARPRCRRARLRHHVVRADQRARTPGAGRLPVARLPRAGAAPPPHFGSTRTRPTPTTRCSTTRARSG